MRWCSMQESSIKHQMANTEKEIEGLLDRIVQSSNTSVIRAYEQRIAELEKKKLASKMLITVHDELVFDVLKKEKAVMIDLVRDLMENPLKLSVPIKVSVKVGQNWLDMKEV